MRRSVRCFCGQKNMAFLPDWAYNRNEATYEMTFSNKKDVPVTVLYYQTVPMSWTILTSSIDYTKPSAGKVMWKIPVVAGGKTTLIYSVRIKLP